MKKPTNQQSWIPKHWTFESDAVASRFDQHVREQLPWYDHLVGCIEHFGAHYIPEGGTVYDIGASTGNVGTALAPYVLDRKATLIAIEKSREMSARWRFQGKPLATFSAKTCQLHIKDVREFEFLPFDFAVLNLVLMFLPPPDRGALLRKLVDLVRPGGAIVIVDKVIAPPGYLGSVMRRLSMRWKLQAGASAEEILAKELSLGGVQRPISPEIIPIPATRFFQFGEFVGWIYERPERGTE